MGSQVIGAGPPPGGLPLGQDIPPGGVVGGTGIRERGAGPRGGCGVDGGGDDRAVGRGQMLGVDLWDRGVDEAAAGLALGGARLVVHAEFRVVLRKQRHVLVQERRRRRQRVRRWDVDVVVVRRR